MVSLKQARKGAVLKDWHHKEYKNFAIHVSCEAFCLTTMDFT